MVIWWQYILGVRVISTLFSKDLIWLNRLHQKLGIYGFLIILIHPLLIYIDRISSSTLKLIPDLTNPVDLHILLGQLAILLLAIIWLTSALGRTKLGFRWWKRIHFLNYPILFLVFIHSTFLGTLLNSSRIPALRYYWLLLFVIFIIVTTTRLLFQFGYFKKKYQLVTLTPVTYDTFELKMKPLKNQIIPDIGQFVYVQINLWGETHPYTVSHFNDTTNELSITIKNLGKYSKELLSLKSGAELFLDGPYGVFTNEAYQISKQKQQEPNPIVLVAGGIGVTPFLRLIDYFKNNPDINPGITLFYGNKNIEDIAFKEEFAMLDNTKFKIIHVLSNAQSIPEGYEGGFISTDLMKKYLNNIAVNDFFICGPPIMMNKLLPQLESVGVPKSQIYAERFSL